MSGYERAMSGYELPMEENAELKKRVAELESDLEVERTWWPFHEDEVEFVAHLRRQREFSVRTFGPPGEPGAQKVAGVLDHLKRELKEVTVNPGDPSEWADLVLLACDGAMRAGHAPEAIARAISDKLRRNEGRTWPDWRQQDPNKAIQHKDEP